jgi:hypothetical protein
MSFKAFIISSPSMTKLIELEGLKPTVTETPQNSQSSLVSRSYQPAKGSLPPSRNGSWIPTNGDGNMSL